MKEKTKISALQLFVMLFLSRVIVSMTMNAQVLGQGNLLDNILSELLMFVYLFLFALPIFLLKKRHPASSLPEIAEKRMGGFGYGISGVYALYFIWMNIVTLALFLTLLLNTMNPTATRWSIAAVVCAVALYGAIRGIETVSRASICVLILFLLGMGAVFVALQPSMEPDYLRPFLTDGTEQLLRGFAVFAARCTTLAEFAVLMPFIQKRHVLGFTIFNGGAVVFISAVLFFIVSCLGEYALLQVFPAYTLATMTEIAGIQRLDALFIGISMMALIIRLACGFFALSECISRVVKPRGRTWVVVGAAVLAVCVSVWICGGASRAGLLFKTEVLLPFTLLTGAVLPLLVLLWDCIKRREKP